MRVYEHNCHVILFYKKIRQWYMSKGLRVDDSSYVPSPSVFDRSVAVTVSLAAPDFPFLSRYNAYNLHIEPNRTHRNTYKYQHACVWTQLSCYIISNKIDMCCVKLFNWWKYKTLVHIKIHIYIYTFVFQKKHIYIYIWSMFLDRNQIVSPWQSWHGNIYDALVKLRDQTLRTCSV